MPVKKQGKYTFINLCLFLYIKIIIALLFSNFTLTVTAHTVLGKSKLHL